MQEEVGGGLGVPHVGHLHSYTLRLGGIDHLLTALPSAERDGSGGRLLFDLGVDVADARALRGAMTHVACRRHVGTVRLRPQGEVVQRNDDSLTTVSLDQPGTRGRADLQCEQDLQLVCECYFTFVTSIKRHPYMLADLHETGMIV